MHWPSQGQYSVACAPRPSAPTPPSRAGPRPPAPPCREGSPPTQGVRPRMPPRTPPRTGVDGQHPVAVHTTAHHRHTPVRATLRRAWAVAEYMLQLPWYGTRHRTCLPTGVAAMSHPGASRSSIDSPRPDSASGSSSRTPPRSGRVAWHGSCSRTQTPGVRRLHLPGIGRRPYLHLGSPTGSRASPDRRVRPRDDHRHHHKPNTGGSGRPG